MCEVQAQFLVYLFFDILASERRYDAGLDMSLANIPFSECDLSLTIFID
jgi:hypothetical protein